MDDEIARAQRAKKGCPFLSTEQAAFYLGLSARKMQAMRAAGTGPAPPPTTPSLTVPSLPPMPNRQNAPGSSGGVLGGL